MRERSKGNVSSELGAGVAIELPRLSADEGSATLARWLVAVGDAVEKGAIIAELETDKATVELEAPAPGRIDSLLISAGTEGLKPGTLLGRITPPSSASSAPAPGEADPVARPDRTSVLESPRVDVAPSAVPNDTPARSPATPLARRVAASHGVDLGAVTGTGVGGRIEKADVERSLEPTAVAAPVESKAAIAAPSAVPSTGGALPAVHLTVRCAVDALLAARARFEGRGETGGARVSINDFVVRAAALALRDVPAANLRRTGSGVQAGGSADIALVVATETGSQLVTLREADRKGLAVLSEEIRSGVEGARAGQGAAEPGPAPSLLVTSFARFGIESAHPMLPPELVAVLAVGAVADEPVFRAGKLESVGRMVLTLAYDPNVVGGAVMAQWLARVRGHLEDPMGMVL